IPGDLAPTIRSKCWVAGPEGECPWPRTFDVGRRVAFANNARRPGPRPSGLSSTTHRDHSQCPGESDCPAIGISRFLIWSREFLLTAERLSEAPSEPLKDSEQAGELSPT